MVRAGTSTSSHLSSLYISGVSRSIEPRTRSPLEQLLQRSLRRRDRHSNLIFGRNWNDESRGQQGTKELIDQTRGAPLKSAPTAVTTLVLHPPYYRHPPIDDGPPPLCLHVVSPTSLRPHLSSACTRDRVKSRNLSRRWLCAVVAESLPVGPETHRPRRIVRAYKVSHLLCLYISPSTRPNTRRTSPIAHFSRGVVLSHSRAGELAHSRDSIRDTCLGPQSDCPVAHLAHCPLRGGRPTDFSPHGRGACVSSMQAGTSHQLIRRQVCVTDSVTCSTSDEARRLWESQ